MSEQEFKVGDVVQLKSGGPAMTVSGVSPGGKSFECSWFDGDKHRRSERFLPGALQPYKPPEAVEQ